MTILQYNIMFTLSTVSHEITAGYIFIRVKTARLQLAQ